MRNCTFLFIIILSLLAHDLSAQKKKRLSKEEQFEQDYYDREFGTYAEEFVVSKIPAKYDGESSVVLAKKTNVIFDWEKAVFTYKVASRVRIYLNDQSAVNDYSEFYYKKANKVQIDVVKPDATSARVDLANAVEVTTEVPSRYRDQYKSGSYFKVAIPNLEVGDIVDFYNSVEDWAVAEYEYNIPLQSAQPMLYQELAVDVCKGWKMYYGALNGAPKFSISDDPGYNIKGKQNGKYTRLMFSSADVEAKEEERWADSKGDGPIVKLLAVANPANMTGRSKMYEEFSTVEFARERLRDAQSVKNLYGKKIGWFVDKIDRDKSDDLTYADQIYQAIKFVLLTKMVEVDSKKATEIGLAFSRRPTTMPNAVFATLLGEELDDADIDCEVVVARRRTASDTDFLLPSEFEIGIHVPSLGRYYMLPSTFSRPDEMPSRLDGLEILKFPYSQVAWGRKIDELTTSGTLPNSNLGNNIYRVQGEVTIGADNKVSYEGSVALNGYFRLGYSSLFLYNHNFMEQIYKDINIHKYLKEGERDTYKPLSELSEATQELYDESKKRHMEVIEGWLSGEHGDVKLDRFVVEEDGMTDEDLKISYAFTSEELVKKAGPNLIFSIGQVSGDQLQLDRKELVDRQSDVKFECPKSITTDVTITLPDGLQAKGLEDVNMKVDNEVGLFECVAVQEGNKIKLTTTKNYKKSEFSADKWPLMVEFLEAAYEQSQKKVILK